MGLAWCARPEVAYRVHPDCSPPWHNVSVVPRPAPWIAQKARLRQPLAVDVAEVAVVGAGPAGLAAAAAAQSRGLQVQVLESAVSVATTWRAHYDRLHLHTTRGLSGLPGKAIPSTAGRWVSRDDFIAYLEDYAHVNQLPIRFGAHVQRVERENGVWRLNTDVEQFRSRNVVIATGYNRTPHIPPWPGLESFSGDLIHSSQYRNPSRYQGLDVLVVGAGNSGAEIATDLAEGGARKVWISVRTPPNIVRRNFGPIANQYVGIAVHRLPVHVVDRVSLALQRLTIGDLTDVGLASPTKGIFTRAREEHIPLIDVGFLRCVRKRQLEVVDAVERLTPGEVVCGGKTIPAQAVIAATGFSRGLEPLVGHLGVLGPTGRPTEHAPRAASGASGLYFIGYTNPIVGNLYEISRVAVRLAAVIAGDTGR